MCKLWWRFVHNVIAHGWLFLAELVGHGLPRATRFHDKTAALAWPPTVDEKERRLQVWERLRDAEQQAEICGFKALSDSVGLVTVLWAAGFEDFAKQALETAAAPLLAGLTSGTHEPRSPSLSACPHGNEIEEGDDGPCGCRVIAGECSARDLHGGACTLGFSHGGSHRSSSGIFSILLLLFFAAGAYANPSYKRPAWRDDDHNCRSTRVEVILRTCKPVTLSLNGCRVTQATCPDLYTGAEISTDTPAQSLQVDHLFPAAVAHARKTWTRKTFADFFNDQRNLVVCRSRTNGRKSDLMPNGWCPGDPKVRPRVARQFRRIVRAYGFRITAAEEVGLVAWEHGACAPGAKVIE